VAAGGVWWERHHGTTAGPGQGQLAPAAVDGYPTGVHAPATAAPGDRYNKVGHPLQHQQQEGGAGGLVGEGWDDGRPWGQPQLTWMGGGPYHSQVVASGAGNGPGMYNSSSSSGVSWVARHDTLPLQLPSLHGHDHSRMGYGAASADMYGWGVQPAVGSHGVGISSSWVGGAHPAQHGQRHDMYPGRQGGVGRRGTVAEPEMGEWGYGSGGGAPASLGLAAHIAGRTAWGMAPGEGAGVGLGGVEQGQGARGMQEQHISPLQQAAASVPAAAGSNAAAGGDGGGGRQPPDLATVWEALQRQRQQRLTQL
jgi:hypothetical protein